MCACTADSRRWRGRSPICFDEKVSRAPFDRSWEGRPQEPDGNARIRWMTISSSFSDGYAPERNDGEQNSAYKRACGWRSFSRSCFINRHDTTETQNVHRNTETSRGEYPLCLCGVLWFCGVMACMKPVVVSSTESDAALRCSCQERNS